MEENRVCFFARGTLEIQVERISASENMVCVIVPSESDGFKLIFLIKPQHPYAEIMNVVDGVVKYMNDNPALLKIFNFPVYAFSNGEMIAL